MKNIRLILQYDGTNYHGFQIQPSVVTIQGTLEETVKAITGEDVRVYGCSRTDAGVHAVRYSAGFWLSTPIPPEKIALVMNNALPDDIRILSSYEADADFHPRFSCVAKKYRYVINTSPDAGVFTKNYEWQLRKPLDVDAMNTAAAHIIGEHDFRSFMTTGPEMESTVRNVHSLEVVSDGDLVKIYIKADGYLYNMVRIITGTLVQVGEGRMLPDKVKDIIDGKDRSLAGPTAPAQGLALYEIYY